MPEPQGIDMNTMHRRILYALVTLSLVWAGMLLGVSFLATPAKFLAPSLTLPVALDIGRQTFGLFSMVETFGAVALVGLAALCRHERLILLFAVLTGSLVALESIWVLPALDARVEIILQGGSLEQSALHKLYVAFEAIKLLLLFAIAWRSLAALVIGKAGTTAK